jgi:hypothetical protein
LSREIFSSKCTKKIAPLNGGKIGLANAVGILKVKRNGEKAVILAEMGGVSADVLGTEITFHTFCGNLSAIINAVNHASDNIQFVILSQFGLDTDKHRFCGCANFGTDQFTIGIEKAEQIALLRGFIKQTHSAISQNFLAIVVPNGMELGLGGLAVGGDGVELAVFVVGFKSCFPLGVILHNGQTTLKPVIDPLLCGVFQILKGGQKIIVRNALASALIIVSHCRFLFRCSRLGAPSFPQPHSYFNTKNAICQAFF